MSHLTVAERMFEENFLNRGTPFERKSFPKEVREKIFWDNGTRILSHEFAPGSFTFLDFCASDRRLMFDFSMGWFHLPLGAEVERTQSGTVRPTPERLEFSKRLGLFGFDTLLWLYPDQLPNQGRGSYGWIPHVRLEWQNLIPLPEEIRWEDPPDPDSEEYLKSCEAAVNHAADALVAFGLPYLREYEDWFPGQR